MCEHTYVWVRCVQLVCVCVCLCLCLVKFTHVSTYSDGSDTWTARTLHELTALLDFGIRWCFVCCLFLCVCVCVYVCMCVCACVWTMAELEIHAQPDVVSRKMKDLGQSYIFSTRILDNVRVACHVGHYCPGYVWRR